MALLVDKHRPRSLEALSYHHDLSERLKALAESGDFPHLLLYGPSGAGKKTRILCLLKALFGPGAEKIKIDSRVFQTTSNRKLEFNIVSSVYHLEITPSDVGNYDRVVVQELLKEVAQTQQVDLSAKQRFKVVVVNEADGLTRDAQSALRRTMEKYSPNLRLILVANSTGGIIAPIRSRTLLVRVAAPTEEEIEGVLTKVGQKERWRVVEGLNKRIARESGRNLRRALLMFEAVYAQNESDKISEKTLIPPPDWEALIEQIAKEIVEEHTPARILQTLAFKLIPKIDDPLKPEVVKWGAFYEHRIKMGSKHIFHLEAFVAKFMRISERCRTNSWTSNLVENLLNASTEVDTTTAAQEEAKAARGERTAENIRYGQGISEHGMGGQTTTSGGVANTDGGYGGVREQVGKTAGSEGSDGAGRTEQGYGGERDMGRDVGA
ncbi:MAG: hypothetical protein Q9157_001433 [Trypethelium eluteriae]